MQDLIRIGIIGSGKVAQGRHIPRLQNIPDVQISHAWSKTKATAESAAKDFGIPNVVSNWEEIIDSPDIDAVIIAAPPVLHMPATLAALNSGKHVLCQARMARNLNEAQVMFKASQNTNLVTTLYPPALGLKGDRVMKRLLHEEGYVGDILDVRVTAISSPVPGPGGWQVDPEIVGVNTMTLGILSEVFNRWIGPGKTVSASSGEPPEVVPQSLVIGVELENGGTASFHLSLRGTNGPGFSIEIYGSRGFINYTMLVEEISGRTEGEDNVHPINISDEEQQDQTTDADFIRSIRKGTPISPDFAEGLRYMEFTEAVAQSLFEKRSVSLPPEPKMDSWGKLL